MPNRVYKAIRKTNFQFIGGFHLLGEIPLDKCSLGMPVYESKDYEKVIKRIQEKIAKLHIKMGKCLTEEEIVSFENCHNVQLPQAYRMFLNRIGDGCKDMLDGFQLNDLKSCPLQELSAPFLLEKHWIWGMMRETLTLSKLI